MHDKINNEKDRFCIIYFIIVPALLMVLFLQASCNVEKTQEGKLPDIDVEDESGKLPDYDVDAADVDIETKEKTIEVPKVVMEEEVHLLRECIFTNIDVYLRKQELPRVSQARI